jgi:hypothetical protein
MDANWFAQFTEQIINKYRQTRNMIHVRVSDNDVAHAALLRIAKRNANAARIDGDAVVDDKAGKTLRETRAAMGIERTW